MAGTSPRRRALRITIAYAALAAAWIAGSDLVLLGATVTTVESIGKGLVFVAVTALLLQFLIERTIGRALQAERASFDRHFDLLSHYANDAIFLVDDEGRIAKANQRAFERYGYPEETLIGMPVAELRVPAERERLPSVLELTQSGGSAVYETVHQTREGRAFPVETSSRMVEVGGRRMVQGIVRDISERERTAQSLRESEERFRAMIEQSISGTCIIGADARFIYANPRLAAILGYATEQELVGKPVLDFVVPENRELVAHNLGRRIAGEAHTARYHFDVVRRDGSRITLGAHGTAGSYGGGPVVIATVQDVTELLRAEEEIKGYVKKLEHAMRGTLEVVSRMVELRDPYTQGHERRVAEICAAIGTELGLAAERIEGLRVAGSVHDVGKIAVPAEILSKPSRLTPAEYELVKQHAQLGYEVLKEVQFPWPVAEVAWQHHERMDGSGYPRGQKGEAILLEARILAVADTLEAMSSHRPYRPGLGIDRALGEIEGGRGRLYDPQVVDACLRLYREKGFTLPA
jgi:PAS domain S-box-containing protein